MRTRRVLCSAAVVLLAGMGLGVGATPVAAATVGVTVAGGNGYGSAANQLAYPYGVALDSSRNVYVADLNNARVQRWAPGATAGVTGAGGHGEGSAADQLDVPVRLAVDDADNLYIADALNARVQRWAPQATFGVTVAGGNGVGSAADQLNAPGGLALDSNGNLYILDAGNARVQLWAPQATSGVTVAGGNGVGSAADQFDSPGGLALDTSENVYVADYGNSRVQRWAPGATSGVTVAGGNGFGSATDQLAYATDVAVDSGGSVYVTDRGFNDRVQLWAPGAAFGVTVAGGNSPGSAADQLGEPNSVAVDDDGNLYVADTANDRVQLWVPDAPIVVPGVGSVLEGNSGTVTVEVPVSLSRSWIKPVTAQWTTLFVPGAPAGQADPSADYTLALGTVMFAPGETTKTVSVSINGDTQVEPDEYIIVSFHDPTNAKLGGVWGLGYGVITDDEQLTVVPGGARVSQPPADILPPTHLQLPVTLSAPSTQTVTAQWNTLYVPGGPPNQAVPTGFDHPDYTPASGTVTFAPGQTEATVTIDILVGGFIEPDEYFVVSFHDPTNAKIGGYWGLGFGIINAGD
jgi:sugar lactone lactonase YvrE